MDEPRPLELRTQIVRGNFARVIRVDGAWGGVTPQWNIHMALYSERWRLPTETVIRKDADGVIRDYPLDPPGVVIREIEMDVILEEKAAIWLRDWLTTKIADLQDQRGASNSGETQA